MTRGAVATPTWLLRRPLSLSLAGTYLLLTTTDTSVFKYV
jgi:hypothetical protein